MFYIVLWPSALMMSKCSLNVCVSSIFQVNDSHLKPWSGYIIIRVTWGSLTFSSRNGVLTGKQDQKCLSSSPTATYKCFSSDWMSFGTISATGKKGFSYHSKLWYIKWEYIKIRRVKEWCNTHFLLESQKGWLGGSSEVLQKKEECQLY